MINLSYAIGLVKFWTTSFAHKPPERSARREVRQREAWLQVDAYLQQESGEFGDDPERLGATLRSFEDYLEDNEDQEPVPVRGSSLSCAPSKVLVLALTSRPWRRAWDGVKISHTRSSRRGAK
jgi:hypothetical protein